MIVFSREFDRKERNGSDIALRLFAKGVVPYLPAGKRAPARGLGKALPELAGQSLDEAFGLIDAAERSGQILVKFIAMGGGMRQSC